MSLHLCDRILERVNFGGTIILLLIFVLILELSKTHNNFHFLKIQKFLFFFMARNSNAAPFFLSCNSTVKLMHFSRYSYLFITTTTLQVVSLLCIHVPHARYFMSSCLLLFCYDLTNHSMVTNHYHGY